MQEARREQQQQPHSTALSTIGARVRALRAALGWGQAKLATAAGVSKPVIIKCESGASIPDLTSTIGIASACDVSVNWVVTGRGPIFNDHPPGLVTLAQPNKAASFYAAVQLLAMSPVPLDFALLEYIPPQQQGEYAVTGGIWWQPSWIAARRCGLILPSSLSDYEKVVWISTWINAGHKCLGAFKLSRAEVQALMQLTPGILTESQAPHCTTPWLAYVTRQPDRIVIPMSNRLSASLDAVLHGRPPRRLLTKHREAIIQLITEHPELVPPLLLIARSLATPTSAMNAQLARSARDTSTTPEPQTPGPAKQTSVGDAPSTPAPIKGRKKRRILMREKAETADVLIVEEAGHAKQTLAGSVSGQ